MGYYVIYDGNCNLCVSLVQGLEQLDRGRLFTYIPMQDQANLATLGVTAQDCELGMLLIDAEQSSDRWQGSAAAEEIGRLLPLGAGLVAVYRSLPGAKWSGDRLYEQVRDNRYAWFGRRSQTYSSHYPACPAGNCASPAADG